MQVFHLWPEHVAALDAWLAVQTQWREGFNGATGLDYGGVEAWARISGLRGDARRERFAELQLMERATLRAWAQARQQRKG